MKQAKSDAQKSERLDPVENFPLSTGKLNALLRPGLGGSINRDRTLRFRFDGKAYECFDGDTLASALLANGVKRVGRSFKLHRPRGTLSAGIEEPNALVQLEKGAFSEPNVRATLLPIYDGLCVKGQNACPNVNWDMLGFMGVFQKLLPASFYYKSMFWPSWHFYEGVVRRLAGLGQAPNQRDAQTYYHRNLHCEVLICGGGPAGLQAAYDAAQSGERVVLMDDQETFGGSWLSEKNHPEGGSAKGWIEDKLAQLRALPHVQLLPRTRVTGYYDHNFLTAVERVSCHLGVQGDVDLSLPRERLWRVRASRVVLATGAIERPLVFADNDRPGIMLASAVRTYLNRYGVAAGQRTVIVTNNDSAYRTAIDLDDAGITVVAVVDTRKDINGHYQQAIIDRGIPMHQGYTVHKVLGRREVRGITLVKHSGNGKVEHCLQGTKSSKLVCDVVAVSGGWTPTIHLYSQAGGTLHYDEQLTSFVPKSCPQCVTVVGAANGDFKSQVKEQAIEPYWFTQGVPTDKQWLDFQYDVKVSDIELAVLENFTSIEHVKRYTTSGMSIDQGKTGNINTLAVMAELSGRHLPEVGTTKFRPPYHPATIGVFAGRTVGDAYNPRQLLPAHGWHLAHDAHMEDYGWQRPDYYLRPGENESIAIHRECLAVRNAVGMFDSSPLGKIEIKGSDATTFLNRIYVNNTRTLKPGFARYGLMCLETGVVFDDGVFVCLAENHYLLHTTSGGVSRIHQWLEEWLQCEWSDLDVIISNVTTQWATVTVSGPKARNLVGALQSDIDFNRDAFPHMQFRTGVIEGVPARVLRASYTGEVTFEISVPARFGLSLWEKVYEFGQPFGITPYGVESLMTLRTEKGYLHIGVDTDGTTNPLDLGWGVPIGKKTDDFIGCRSLKRPNDERSDRLQFVGLEALNPADSLPLGGHIVDNAEPIIPVESQGYVTSARMSPSLNSSIGLGNIKSGRRRMGDQVYVFANGNTVAAKIVNPAHFDPKGKRLNG
jgi:sarcosine oxidase subunit alpha